MKLIKNQNFVIPFSITEQIIKNKKKKAIFIFDFVAKTKWTERFSDYFDLQFHYLCYKQKSVQYFELRFQFIKKMK